MPQWKFLVLLTTDPLSGSFRRPLKIFVFVALQKIISPPLVMLFLEDGNLLLKMFKHCMIDTKSTNIGVVQAILYPLALGQTHLPDHVPEIETLLDPPLQLLPANQLREKSLTPKLSINLWRTQSTILVINSQKIMRIITAATIIKINHIPIANPIKERLLIAIPLLMSRIWNSLISRP